MSTNKLKNALLQTLDSSRTACDHRRASRGEHRRRVNVVELARSDAMSWNMERRAPIAGSMKWSALSRRASARSTYRDWMPVGLTANDHQKMDDE